MSLRQVVRRLAPRLIGILAACTSFVAAAPPVEAQFFSSKWGGFGGGGVQTRPMPPRTFSLRSFGRFSPYSTRAETYDDSGGDWNGAYRTLCVRLCDGYYFPVSYRTTRGRMHRDAKICETSCDCETKLFYLPSSSSDIKSATDFSGQSYGRLENAFVYRQTWDLGCSCRPAPWSSAEVLRHDGYGVVEAERQAELQARKGETLAGLIAREDAKEAELAAKFLSEVGGNSRRPVAVLKSRRSSSYTTVEAHAPVPVLPTEIDAGYENVIVVQPMATVAMAEPVEPEPDVRVESVAGPPVIPPQSVAAPKKPARARRLGASAGRPQKSASGQGKAARPGSRGFFQM